MSQSADITEHQFGVRFFFISQLKNHGNTLQPHIAGADPALRNRLNEGRIQLEMQPHQLRQPVYRVSPRTGTNQFFEKVNEFSGLFFERFLHRFECKIVHFAVVIFKTKPDERF